VKDSYRRLSPGPGKPVTTQRELYLRLMRQGLTNAEECRQAGINIRTGKRWRYGRRLRVNGREYTYGPISAAPPVISARFLSETNGYTSPICTGPGCRSARSQSSLAALRRRSAESCAATLIRPAVPITRPPRIGGQPVSAVGPGRANQRSMSSRAPRSNSCSIAAGGTPGPLSCSRVITMPPAQTRIITADTRILFRLAVTGRSVHCLPDPRQGYRGESVAVKASPRSPGRHRIDTPVNDRNNEIGPRSTGRTHRRGRSVPIRPGYHSCM